MPCAYLLAIWRPELGPRHWFPLPQDGNTTAYSRHQVCCNCRIAVGMAIVVWARLLPDHPGAILGIPFCRTGHRRHLLNEPLALFMR